MLLDRNTFLKLKKAGYAEMRAFCERLYRQGFEDGANADVDPNIKYIAVKDGTEYICGNCGAKLELEEIDGRASKSNQTNL